MQLEMKFQLMRVQLYDFCGLSYQPIQTIALLINNRKQIFALWGIQLSPGQERLGRCLDGGKGSTELMSHRIEQYRAQAIAFPGGFGFGQFLNRPCSFNSDCRQAANRFQRLPRQITTRQSDRPYRTNAHAQRHKTKLSFSVEHRLSTSADRFQLLGRKQRSASIVEVIGFLPALQEHSGAADCKGIHDVLWNVIEQLKYVFRNQQ